MTAPKNMGPPFQLLDLVTREYLRGDSAVPCNLGSNAPITPLSPSKAAAKSAGAVDRDLAPFFRFAPLLFAELFFGTRRHPTRPSPSPAPPPISPTASAWQRSRGPDFHLPTPSRKSLPRFPAPAASPAPLSPLPGSAGYPCASAAAESLA